MAYCKKILFIFLILFIFICNFSFADSVEDVSTTTITDLAFDSHSNYYVSVSGRSVGYFELEKGYIYHISQSRATTAYLAVSSDIPSANVSLDYIGSISQGETYNYLVTTDNTYLCLSFTNSYGVVVTREKVVGQDSAINDLVSYVGFNALWGIFGSGIDFIIVAFLVAFGIFIIYKLITGISKGKSKF